MRVTREWFEQHVAKQSTPKGGPPRMSSVVEDAVEAGACELTAVVSLATMPDGTIDGEALQLVHSEPPARRKSQRPPKPLERDVLAAALKLLRLHPKVAFAARMNSGLFKVQDSHGERWVRAAFKGCSDILGMLRDGRLMVCECKRPGEALKPEQQAFLDHVKRHGGVAFVARSIDDVTNALRVA